MSEVTIFSKQTSVSTIRRELSDFAKASASSGLTSRRIQTNTNGTFKRIVNGEQIGTAVRGEIDVIIAAWLPSVSRTFYQEEYDPNGKATLPDCWSNLGTTPEAGASNKQASSCVECPQNIKGSGKIGGKACRYQRRIAVLIAGDETGELYQFNVPGKSLFGKGLGNSHPFESYNKFLTANGEQLDTVVTTISFDLNADTLELLFTPLRGISDEEYELLRSVQKQSDAKRYISLTIAQVDGVTALPPAAAKPPAPVKPAAPVKVVRSDEPDDEDEDEGVVAAPPPSEPIKRSTVKKVEVMADKADLAAIVDAWADQ